MTDRGGATVLALPPSTIADRPTATLGDLDSTLEPDAVYVLGPDRKPQAFARTRTAFDAPAFHPPLETGGEDPIRRVTMGDDGCPLAFAVSSGRRALEAAPNAATELSSTLSDPSIAAVVCDDISTTIRSTVLETHLDGAATLAGTLPTDAITTVLTGSEPAGYDAVWHMADDTGAVRHVDHETIVGVDPLAADCVSVRIRGVGPADGYGNSQSIAEITVTGDGIAGIETHKTSDFGLEAVSGIGPKTADRLADRDVKTRDTLLETPIPTLADLPGVSPAGARRMHHHATVLETGEPLRLTDESLPGEGWREPPLCLDIETDGLSPTIIWQIGVYDPTADSYQAFVEREEPNEPGRVIEAFCDWLLGVHPDRALLTWNGWGFDFRHLGSFVAKHAPHYADEWESVPKLDLYLWAVTNEHALLPGRTNKLEDVAEALRYEGAGTGLDGAQTAAAYQRFARTGDPLEWDRHETYCEDDCRALWHVYERLHEAPGIGSAVPSSGGSSDGDLKAAKPIATEPNAADPSTDDTEQTGLDNF